MEKYSFQLNSDDIYPNKANQSEDAKKASIINTAYLHELVILPSFHRCGNTLTRELLEGVTDILTGSDDCHYQNDSLKSESFLDFEGQGLTNQSVWVFKTHYPARKGFGNYKFDKIILIIRNPFDALDSMFNLYLTNSHTKSIQRDEYSNFFQDWEGLIKEEILIWNNFYEFWYNYSKKQNLEGLIYIVRYEDLILNTREQISSIMKFLLNYKFLENTIIEKKIDYYLANRKLKYKPRKGSNLYSLENYSQDQIKFILENSVKIFSLFGYDSFFKDLITNYELNYLYNDFKNNSKDIDFIELNKISISKCLDELYPFDYIKVPVSKGNQQIIDSEQNLLNFCEYYRCGPRRARLSNEISKLIKIEDNLETN